MKGVSKVWITDADGKARVIGLFDSNRNLFTSKRRGAFMHRMVGRDEWGINKERLDEFAACGATVKIIDLDSNMQYVASALQIQTEGEARCYRGQEPQYFMELGKWNKIAGGRG